MACVRRPLKHIGVVAADLQLPPETCQLLAPANSQQPTRCFQSPTMAGGSNVGGDDSDTAVIDHTVAQVLQRPDRRLHANYVQRSGTD